MSTGRPALQKKVCMLGAYAVGKTSLVRRFVKDVFSEGYRTTVGVKITKKELVLEERSLSLLLWDLHGDDEFQTVRDAYLKGAAGALVVADGTRAATLEQALALRARLRSLVGEVPAPLLVNKRDLEGAWEVEDERLAALGLAPEEVLFTSALTGEGVEAAFERLGRALLVR